MSFWEIPGLVLIGPLKLLFEVVFVLSNRFTKHPGLAIIFLSLIMNLLVLPLYRQADRMQEQARDIDKKLRRGVDHIKKVFSGDERMMILQTYYRQNHYRPTDSLKGSVSLLLEIPFFIAAYQFLSHLDLLEGVSLWAIRDLSRPDGLLVIGGYSVHLLPILMTAVNLLSSYLYAKDFPVKTKVQLYGMALIFLIFLYRSPSGLVFYWTLNNLFSLAKTVCYKLRDAKRTLSILAFCCGFFLLAYTLIFGSGLSVRRRGIVLAAAFCLLIPLLWRKLRGRIPFPIGKNRKEGSPHPGQFLLCSVFLTIFTGLLIPSAFIAASPQDYVDVTCFYHPLRFVVGSLALAAGTFLVWVQVFYRLAGDGWRVRFELLLWVLCGMAVTNYMFFGTKLGIISSALQYENGFFFSWRERIVNLAVLLAVAAGMLVCARGRRKAVTPVLLAVTLAIGAMSALNVSGIQASLRGMEERADQMNGQPEFRLSRDGQNVIVIMLDRALGACLPYLMEEKPQLLAQFDGFTYYPNTISYGAYTIFGATAMLGGYEYTPVEMNRRDSELNVSKHNEALRVVPVLFLEEGFEVTVCDPPYPNYESVPDPDFYADWPDIRACSAKGVFNDPELKMQAFRNYPKKFFALAVMKSSPLLIQPLLYTGGSYNQINTANFMGYTVQTAENPSEAWGMNADFMDDYSALVHLSDMTEITDEAVNTFLYFGNETTHDATLLNEPEYTPGWDIHNQWYDAANVERFTVDGRTMNVSDALQMSHYHVNMAAILKLGEWLDYLREQEVYDNTRIILVSDHGRGLGHLNELVLDDGSDSMKDMENYFPLLMVKDFDSTGFAVSDVFMTNADVPTLAARDVIEDPVNPFTGRQIDNGEKTAHRQYIMLSEAWHLPENTGNVYLPCRWTSVQDNLWDREQWEFYEDKIILREYAFPEAAE